MNPNGIPSRSPGLRHQPLPWVKRPPPANPNGVVSSRSTGQRIHMGVSTGRPGKAPIDLRTSRENLIARRSRPRESLRRRLHRAFSRESRLSQDLFVFLPDFFV
jgi:hypothetical protein